MKKLTTFILLALLSTGTLFGQTNKELMKMGDAAMINGQYSNAVHYYAFILFKIKEGEEALYYPYEISTAYREPEKEDNGTIAPPTSPNSKEIKVIHKLADAYRLADDYKNAEKYAEMAIEYDRYNAKALVNRGNCLYVRNEFLRAKEQYLEAIGVEADCIESLYNLAFVNKKLNMFMEALQVKKILNKFTYYLQN